MKIKLAIFIDGEFIPSYSGASNRFHYLSRYLQMSGKVDVIVFLCDRGWCNYQDIAKEPFLTYLLKPKDYYNNPEFILSLLQKEKIQIIQWANIEGCISQGILLSVLSKTYLVLEAHYDALNFAVTIGTSDAEIKRIKNMHSIFGISLDHVIALSNDDIPIIKRNLSLSNKSITCIPSGVDYENFIATPNLKTKKVVFLGNLYFESNIKAIDMIHKNIYPSSVKKGYSFIIGGDVSDTIIKKYQNDNFIFLGKVDNLNNFFKDATVAICPILDSPGMRIKILNYLAAGLPTITTSKGASGFPNKEILLIEDNINLYPKVIDSLVKNKFLYLSYSNKSRKYIKNTLNWNIVADRCIKAYKDILSQKLREKKVFIKYVSKYKNYSPSWIKEVIKNGRFKDDKSIVKDNHFMKINRGIIRQYLIKIKCNIKI